MKTRTYSIPFMMVMVLFTLVLVGCDGITDEEDVFYTLTIKTTGEGTVDPEPGEHEVEKGAIIDLEAQPDEGYDFYQWIGDVSEPEEPTTTITMDDDKTVTAVFEIAFAGGSGTVEDPYLIETNEQLDAVRGHLDRHFKLVAHLDLSTYSGDFEPIGGDGFSGSFNGDSFTISNLTIEQPEEDNIGLFGKIDEEGLIENLVLEDVTIHGYRDVGGLAGENQGTITNSSTSGGITGENWNTGGLVGYNFQGTISNSHSSAQVSGEGDAFGGLVGNSREGEISNSYATGDVRGAVNRIGGLIGQLYYGTLTDSYATGEVEGESSNEGGLVGQNSFGEIINSYATGDVYSTKWNTGGLVGLNNGTIKRCFATGRVTSTGSSYVGGLVGLNSGGDATILDSYATGDVTAEDGERIGGLAGHVNYGSVRHSYSIGAVNGREHLGGLIGSIVHGEAEIEYSYYDRETSGRGDMIGKGIPKTTAEMKESSTFLPEWDFDTIWAIDEGISYPYLQWE